MEAYFADNMSPATRGARPYSETNYQIPTFPMLGISAPSKTSEALDKVVGCPILPRSLRIPGAEECIQADCINHEWRLLSC